MVLEPSGVMRSEGQGGVNCEGRRTLRGGSKKCCYCCR